MRAQTASGNHRPHQTVVEVGKQNDAACDDDNQDDCNYDVMVREVPFCRIKKTEHSEGEWNGTDDECVDE